MRNRHLCLKFETNEKALKNKTKAEIKPERAEIFFTPVYAHWNAMKTVLERSKSSFWWNFASLVTFWGVILPYVAFIVPSSLCVSVCTTYRVFVRCLVVDSVALSGHFHRALMLLLLQTLSDSFWSSFRCV